MKKLFRLSILAQLSAIFIADNCHAAGFDCARASTEVEKIICANPRLSLLDEQLSRLYKSALQSENKGSENKGLENKQLIKQQQQNWLSTIRNSCREPACLLKAYQQRLIAFQTSSNDVWKLFKDEQLGIEFSYPAQRKILARCHDSNNCIALVEAAMPVNTDYLLAFEVFDGDLAKIAVEQAVFEKTGQNWIAKGRSGEYPARLLTSDGWQGISATVDCGITDSNGFHAATGECLWAVLSNGKRSVVIDSEGVVGNDELSARSIQSMRFTQ